MIIFFVPKRLFRVLHQNVNGLLSKTHLLDIHLLELREQNKEPDLICLTEIHIEKGCESIVNISGYSLAASYCRTKKSNRSVRGGPVFW